MDWNDPKSITMSFELKADDSAVEFFRREYDELKGFGDAVNARMKAIFDENIKVGDGIDEMAYNQILKVFMLGYGHGWNDRKALIDYMEKEK